MSSIDDLGALTIPDGSIFHANSDVAPAQAGIFTKIYANGDVYRGELNQGQRSGRGLWLSADGVCSYDGCWRDDLRDGVGVSNTAVETYTGFWRADLKHCFGILHRVNGDQYEGEFYADNPHQRGTYRWSNGDTYVGRWHDGSMHGKGVLCFVEPGGAVCMKATWEAGKVQGWALVSYLRARRTFVIRFEESSAVERAESLVYVPPCNMRTPLVVKVDRV
jgi:hypothetical protein